MVIAKPRRSLYFVWTYLEWGGAQIYLLAIMKLAKRDWDITVILPRDSRPDILNFLNELDINYEFIDVCLDVSSAPSIKKKLLRQWRRIHSEIVTFLYLRRFNLRESILHIESAPWQSWILFTAFALRRANVFVTMHNFLPKLPKWREIIFRARLQFLSRLPGFHIFTANQNTKDRLKGWVESQFWNRITVTYACINPMEINAVLAENANLVQLRQKHGIDESKFVILCVGQFIERKGRWVLLEAAKWVTAQDNNVAFVWLTPALPSELEMKRIENYNLADSFQLILSSKVGDKRHDVLKFFRIADVFALPSYIEGLPIALLEAMALGLPSISTNVYAIPEAVKNLETGLLIEAGDSQALADTILRLKNDSELRNKLAQQGSRFVLENFDEREAARIAITAYQQCFADDK